MKALLGTVIALSLVSISTLSIAADVGDIIDTDTVWDFAGSPHYIASDVQIAEGVT